MSVVPASFNTLNSLGIGTTTVTVTKPTGTVDGDVLIAFIGSRTTGSTANPTPPTGWTLFQTQVGSTNKGFWAYYKIASGEPSSWTWTLASSGFSAGSVIRITGAETTAPVGVSNTATSGNSTSIVLADTITPPIQSSLLLFAVFASRAATGLTDINSYAITNNNPAWTELYDIGDNSSNSIEFTLAYATYAPATATGNSTATAGPSSPGEGVAGFLISISRTTKINVSDSQSTVDQIFFTIAFIIRDIQSTVDSVLSTISTLWVNTQKNISTIWKNINKS